MLINGSSLLRSTAVAMMGSAVTRSARTDTDLYPIGQLRCSLRRVVFTKMLVWYVPARSWKEVVPMRGSDLQLVNYHLVPFLSLAGRHLVHMQNGSDP
jgi:hypothetical protein